MQVGKKKNRKRTHIRAHTHTHTNRDGARCMQIKKLSAFSTHILILAHRLIFTRALRPWRHRKPSTTSRSTAPHPRTLPRHPWRLPALDAAHGQGHVPPLLLLRRQRWRRALLVKPTHAAFSVRSTAEAGSCAGRQHIPVVRVQRGGDGRRNGCGAAGAIGGVPLPVAAQRCVRLKRGCAEGAGQQRRWQRGAGRGLDGRGERSPVGHLSRLRQPRGGAAAPAV